MKLVWAVRSSAPHWPPSPPSSHWELGNESAIVRKGWATEGPALLFLQTSPPISHAGHKPGKCYLFLHELTAGEILTFTVCVVVAFGGQAGEQCACVVLYGLVGILPSTLPLFPALGGTSCSGLVSGDISRPTCFE